MKNNIFYVIIIILFTLCSCEKDVINQNQIGKWEVFWKDVNGSFISIDTFNMVIKSDHSMHIDSSFAFQFMPDLFWTTSINESEINLYKYDTTNKETIHFKKHLSISTNEQNHQIWEKNTTDDPEYPTFTVMELTRIE